jgi:hypothetical protein
MPTQKSSGFLFNFLAAFRAQSQSLPKPQPARPTTTGVTTQTQTLWTSTTTQSKPQSASSENIAAPRPINPKAHAYTTTTAATATSTSPADLRPALQHNVTPQTHLPRSPPSPGLPVYGPPNKPSPSYPTAVDSRRARRRGSDSSSDSGGFREVKGSGEKWFVGGRTATGEEKYYKLGLVKRERSADRISADQLSL